MRLLKSRASDTVTQMPSQKSLQLLVAISLILFWGYLYNFLSYHSQIDEQIQVVRSDSKNEAENQTEILCPVILCPDYSRKQEKASIQHGKRCSANQAEWVSTQEPTANSNCPLQDSWMSDFLHASHNNEDAVLISIGCNRGDDILFKMRKWSRNSSYSFKAAESDFNAFFGVIRSCPLPDELDPPVSDPRPAQGFCVEAMTSTFGATSSIIKKHGWDQSLRVIHAAASSTPGEVKFPVSHAGVESLGIGMGQGDEQVVRAITVDQLIEEHGITRVDILSIDTEGNDFRVILGSLNSLHMVRLLEFEYHAVARWANSDLQDLVDLLDQFGFDCYWQGNQGQLWRLTGCWHDSYYVKRFWSNVACAKRNEHSLHAAMEAISKPNL